jgi:hypothetical protein
MKRWLGLFLVLAVMAVAAVLVSNRFRRFSPAGQFRFATYCSQKVQIGMAAEDVEALCQLDGRRPKTVTGPVGRDGAHDRFYFSNDEDDGWYLAITFDRKGLVTDKRMIGPCVVRR